MLLDASAWVSTLLAAKACDWTPSGAPPMLRVLYAPMALDAQAVQGCTAILSGAEVQRADRFVTEAARAHFLQRRAFRRYCGALALGSSRGLAQIDFRETEKGCPYLPAAPDLRFSFSACRHGFMGAWSATHAIGVDIEDNARRLEAAELAQRYFLGVEARAVARAEGPARMAVFLKLWTLKEAALKSIGEGLPYGLDAFAFEVAPVLRTVQAPHDYGGPGRFDVHLVERAETTAAIVIRTLKSRHRKVP